MTIVTSGLRHNPGKLLFVLIGTSDISEVVVDENGVGMGI